MIKEIVLGVGGGIEKKVSIKDEDSREGEEIKMDISSAAVSRYMCYQ